MPNKPNYCSSNEVRTHPNAAAGFGGACLRGSPGDVHHVLETSGRAQLIRQRVVCICCIEAGSNHSQWQVLAHGQTNLLFVDDLETSESVNACWFVAVQFITVTKQPKVKSWVLSNIIGSSWQQTLKACNEVVVIAHGIIGYFVLGTCTNGTAQFPAIRIQALRAHH